MSQKNLAELGKKIASIDEQIIELLADRMEVAGEIELAKRDGPFSIIRPDIEKSRMSDCVDLAVQMGISVSFVESLFYQIHAESIRVQLAQREKDTRAWLESEGKKEGGS